MANIMTKRGNLDNIVTYEHICDTFDDIQSIDPHYITLGSTCVVINGESGGLEVYMANSNKEWQSISITGSESGGGSSSGIHICAQDEYDSVTGMPTIEDPLSNTFYLTPGGNETNDLYNEWIWLEDDEEWEKFGSATTAISQSDWNQSDSSADDFIKNKPAIRQQTNGGILENSATDASGLDSHAEGGDTTASGRYSHAEGGGTTASGVSSHAEGGSTIASGSCSHTEGGGTRASGNTSHAEGGGAIASGGVAHAEGSNTTASGDVAHAEGSFTTAFGSCSHAEGSNTTASGGVAHAEGSFTTASGDIAHAEGSFTTASGSCSHAEGSNTIANHSNQHVFGMFNVADASNNDSYQRGNFVEIIGNGSNENARSNARTLDWNGNEWLAGNLTLNQTTLTESKLQDLNNLNIVTMTQAQYNALTNEQKMDGTIRFITDANGETIITKQSIGLGNVDNTADADKPVSTAQRAAIDAVATKTVEVTGTDVIIEAVSNTRYICGELSTLDFTPSSTGISDVLFTSGSSKTILTLPNTVKMPDWFEVESNMIYEISIADGVYGVVTSWAV